MRVHVYAIAKQPAQIYTFRTVINTATSAHTWVLAAVAIVLPGLQLWALQGPRGSRGTSGTISVCRSHWLLTCRVHHSKCDAGCEAKQTASSFLSGFISLVSEWWCHLPEGGSFSRSHCRYEPDWWRRAERPAKRERKQGQSGFHKKITQNG